MGITASPVLFGHNQHRSRQFSIIAVAIFLLYSMVYTAPVIGDKIPSFQVLYITIAIAFGVAIVNAYLNDGLLVSTLITGAVGVGGLLAMYIGASLGPVTYSTAPYVPVLIIGIFVGVGVGAFIIGAGTRRVVTYIR